MSLRGGFPPLPPSPLPVIVSEASVIDRIARSSSFPFFLPSFLPFFHLVPILRLSDPETSLRICRELSRGCWAAEVVVHLGLLFIWDWSSRVVVRLSVFLFSFEVVHLRLPFACCSSDVVVHLGLFISRCSSSEVVHLPLFFIRGCLSPVVLHLRLSI